MAQHDDTGSTSPPPPPPAPAPASGRRAEYGPSEAEVLESINAVIDAFRAGSERAEANRRMLERWDEDGADHGTDSET